MKTNIQGSIIPTEETWHLINGEFAFSNNETGCVNEDGTVFYDDGGMEQYVFSNKDDAFKFLFGTEENVIPYLHSFYIGSREEHPTLDGWCKRMGIDTQEEEDGSSVWSDWKPNK